MADLTAAKRRREYAELIVTREVAAALLQQSKAKESLDIYVGVRDQARENLAVIRRVYELGRNQLLDVIAEQRRLIDIETGFVDAFNRYYQASVRVRLAAGIE
jgi:cobalt-zinc-cadmium efflux system outer membrane protein